MSDRPPLYDVTLQEGATFAEEAGWLVPTHYGNPEAEYRLAREEAALFDLSHRGKLELTGPESAFFLHNLASNDIKNLPYSTGCEAFLCNAQARVLARTFIYHLKFFDDPNFLGSHDSFFLDLDPGLEEKAFRHLDRHLVSEKVEIFQRTRSMAQLHLAGGRVEAILAEAGVKNLPPLELMQLGWGEQTVQFRRLDRLGLPGFDIVFPAASAAAQWQKWRTRGAIPAGQQAYEMLRVEAGNPVYGKDIDENIMAPEVGRTSQAISYTKGCYLGQEPIVRIRNLGHLNRVLTGLTLSGSDPVPRESKLWHNGKEAGQVTSSVVSLRLGSAIALAYVRRGHSEPGTLLEVETAEGRRQAKVSSLPFSG